MGPAEIFWRGRRAVSATTGAPRPPDRRLVGSGSWAELLRSFRAGQGRPVVLSREGAARVADADPDGTAQVLAAADRAREGLFAFFGYGETRLSRPIDWHRDGLTGYRWPADRPGARIDHRLAPADPKWIWELTRLQHLPWLSQAWLLTGDEGYAETALEDLDGWIVQSPPGRGIAWRGGFEAGVRAISVAIALQGLRDAPGLTAERYARAVRALWHMARRAWGERSLHSSANNHLVGELAGCATVALLHPELTDAPAWRRRALAALGREAARQILPDGAGAEQAFDYQVFTADLLLVVAALLRRSGQPVPRAMEAALERGAGYMAEILGDGDPVPRYGDSDEGFALRLGAEPARDPRGHLGAVAALLGHAAARRAGRLDLQGRMLTGIEGERRFLATVHGPPAAPVVAPSGGMVVLRAEDVRVTFDVGPLGYLAIAAHGHADALAVTLSRGGRELVGDPGTGSYFGHPAWRRAHRSTAAHATVGVDGRDQSEPGGPFLWTRHARARLLHADPPNGFAVGDHDGYRALPEAVDHRRHVLLTPGGELLVVDRLRAAARHTASTAWPLHPELQVEPTAAGWRATSDGTLALEIAQAATAPVEPYAIRGDEQSALGWWSERLESRVPAWLVGGRIAWEGEAVIATLLWPGEGARRSPGALSLVHEGHHARLRWGGEGVDACEVLLDLRRPDGRPRLSLPREVGS